MKRLAWFALAALAACSSSNTQMSNPDTKTLEPVFADWKNAVVDGNFEYVYEHTSVAMKSRWVYSLFTPNYTEKGPKFTEFAMGCYKKLPRNLREEFEAWLKVNRMSESKDSMPGPLPSHIISSEWLRETLKEHFKIEHPTLKHDFAAKEYRDAYIDGDAATLTVLNIKRETEMYEMVKENDVWKMNYWKPAPPKQ